MIVKRFKPALVATLAISSLSLATLALAAPHDAQRARPRLQRTEVMHDHAPGPLAKSFPTEAQVKSTI